MITDVQIEPHRVTKPIQLLAAWLVGLIAVDLIFLEVAARIEPGSWERGLLIVASVLNVPLFLAAMFILQTRFRPELQDDAHYMQYRQYVSKGTAEIISVATSLENKLQVSEPAPTYIESERDSPLGREGSLDWAPWKVAVNAHHPQFEEIRLGLRDAGIPVAVIFGEAFRKNSKPPNKWVVSVHERLPFAHTVHLLRVITKFDFVGFHRWVPVRDVESADIYLGSYGVTRYSAIAPELSDLLVGEPEEADLTYYMEAHAVVEDA